MNQWTWMRFGKILSNSLLDTVPALRRSTSLIYLLAWGQATAGRTEDQKDNRIRERHKIVYSNFWWLNLIAKAMFQDISKTKVQSVYPMLAPLLLKEWTQHLFVLVIFWCWFYIRTNFSCYRVLFWDSSDNERISFHLSECDKHILCTGEDLASDRSRDCKSQQVSECSVSRNLFLQNGGRGCVTMPLPEEVPTWPQVTEDRSWLCPRQ